jgi:hypothetical protein
MREPRLCRVPTVFRTWIHQVGARVEGFRLPLVRRGVRTTLVNGVLTLNEVETSPRHHVQRRATFVYSLARATVKHNVSGHRDPGAQLLGDATESRSRLNASSRARVSLSADAWSSFSRNSSSAM